MKQHEVFDALKSGVVKIKFLKVSTGEERVFQEATINTDIIREYIELKERPEGQEPVGIKPAQSIFSIQDKAWRSFKWDTVIEVNDEKYEGE